MLYKNARNYITEEIIRNQLCRKNYIIGGNSFETIHLYNVIILATMVTPVNILEEKKSDDTFASWIYATPLTGALE